MRQPTWLYLETVDSTNKYLKEHAGELPDFTACYSLNQTAGAGRRGRDWSSQRDTMLALSFLLHGTQLQDMQVLPLLCAMAAVKGLGALTGRAFGIKWPNDVVLEGKKICGILCESRILGEDSFAVCGIGFNLLATEDYYRAENLPHAGSVFSLTGLRLSPEKVREQYLAEFAALFDKYRLAGSFAPLAEEYRASSVNIGRQVRVIWEREEAEGLCTGIAPDGTLLVEIDGEERSIRSGEASVRGLYGYI